MREKQVVVMPTDDKYETRNMTWTSAMEFFNLSNEELEEVIEKGLEVKGAFIDEAIVYDNQVS